MMVLPIEASRPLLAPPARQFKDKEKQEALTDRDTGAALVEVAVSLTSGTGVPQVLRVPVPQPGVPKDLAMGRLGNATGLTLIAGGDQGPGLADVQGVSVDAGKGDLMVPDWITGLPKIVAAIGAVVIAVVVAVVIVKVTIAFVRHVRRMPTGARCYGPCGESNAHGSAPHVRLG